MNKSYEINFTKNSIFKSLIAFTLPLILSNMLQLFYNAADIIVVGQFAGKESLAAVGSTSSMINLLINLLIGLSIGTNVLVSNGFGRGDNELLHRAVHTSILLSFFGGIIVGIIGFLFADKILILMQTPADVLPKATLYTKIYFAGLPTLALYNFGSAILRATGDTRRPLYFLIISGIINVLLNLFFVIVCRLDVAGVALATVISQIFSCSMVLICLIRTKGAYRLIPSKLRIYKPELIRIISVGLPSGIQSSLFSVSNILIQSSINSFGSIAVAGNSAGSNVEGFIYNAMNAVSHASLTFTAQNFSVGNITRMKKGIVRCMALVCIIWFIVGGAVILFSDTLLSFYSPDPEVIAYGKERLMVIGGTYFLCGLMEVFTGAMRGLAYSVLSMVVSLIGACGFRILWIFTVFQQSRTLPTLFASYPISWLLTGLTLAVSFYILMHKFQKQLKKEF